MPKHCIENERNVLVFLYFMHIFKIVNEFKLHLVPSRSPDYLFKLIILLILLRFAFYLMDTKSNVSEQIKYMLTEECKYYVALRICPSHYYPSMLLLKSAVVSRFAMAIYQENKK